LLAIQSNLAQNTPAGTGFEATGPLTIWSVAVDELTPTQLAELSDSAEFPSQLQWGKWSPDGRYVTFWSGPLGASILADGLPLSMLDSMTGEIIPVGDDASLVTTDYHDWSPDSSRLAVTLGAGREAWRNKSLAIFDVAEGTTTDIDAAVDHIPGRVAWSPDGSLIAYAANPAGTSDLEPDTINFDNPGIAARRIYLLDADTGELRLLNDVDSFQDAPVWSTDGTALYYVQRMDDQLQLMAADPITGDAAPVEGATEPLPDLAGYYGKFDWSHLLQQMP
jgi:Tol biopolymer transport system component